MKTFNRAIKECGTPDVIGGVAVTVLTANSSDLITRFEAAASFPTTANRFAVGAVGTLTTSGAKYVNTGTAASPTWSLSSPAAGSVALAQLAAGITPSHVVKFAGKATWSGSGATLAVTVSGVAATDIVLATIQTKPSQAAYLVGVVPSTNTVTIEISTANTSNDAVIAYQVLRAAA